MNKEFVQKWIDALRSGKYIQGRGSLRIKKDDLFPKPRYCCLGVACEIHPDVKLVNRGTYKIISQNENFTTKIPDGSNIEEDLGLNYSLTKNLMCMNDIQNFSFKEIADFIEENIMTKDAANEND